MAVGSPTIPRQPIPSHGRLIQVLRWAFRRGDESLVCELGLDCEDSAYELSTIVPWNNRPSIERFNDAQAALQRQASVERVLVEEGWSLDRFETTTTIR